MADNFGTLNPTTLSNASDAYLVRQNGIDYRQSREDMAAGMLNARWSPTGNYDLHTRVITNNGAIYIAQQPSGPDRGGAVDPITDTDISHWKFDTSDFVEIWSGNETNATIDWSSMNDHLLRDFSEIKLECVIAGVLYEATFTPEVLKTGTRGILTYIDTSNRTRSVTTGTSATDTTLQVITSEPALDSFRAIRGKV